MSEYETMQALIEQRAPKTPSDLIEDLDIPNDPYYLKYYRPFHNHPLDTELIN